MAHRSLFKRTGYSVSRGAARLVGATLFRLRCYGRAHVPPSGGGLVCSNHQSVFDPILVGLSCDRRLNYLARKTLFQNAVFRRVIEFYDAIPIDRDGFGIGGIKETLRRLKQEELVLVFPEGTRTLDGEVGQLKAGFCALARRGRVPLLPVAIDGAFDSLPRQARFPRWARFGIQFGPPMSPRLIESLDDQELIAELRRRICACHDAVRNAVGDWRPTSWERPDLVGTDRPTSNPDLPFDQRRVPT